MWRGALDPPPPVQELLVTTLSQEERGRAAMIVAGQRRRRWETARALLRLVLAKYLQSGPDDVPLGFDSRGRPLLLNSRVSPPLAFNLSRSGNLGLYAVTRSGRVGVDVERVRDDVDSLRVADRLFSATERTALRDLPATRRREAFFSCWTRKEAYAKALGRGLGMRLSSFTVSLAPASPALVDQDRSSEWTVWDAAPAAGYAGAVAAEGTGLELRRWEITYP